MGFVQDEQVVLVMNKLDVLYIFQNVENVNNYFF